MKGRSIKCKCFPPITCSNGSSECSSEIGCFYSIQTDNLNYVIGEHYGCLLNNAFSVFTCLNYKGTNVTCCFSSNSSDYCNAHLSLTENGNIGILFLFITFSAMLLLLLFWLAFAYFKKIYIVRQKPFASQSPTCLSEFVDSGSGAGKPFLVNQTIARQTTLLMCIGKGRFGEVWRAICNEEIVAVKIFSSRDGASWTRETQIYTTALLCHPNILAYYASDMISHGGYTQLWLVTAYHAAGSLHDFLSISEVVEPQRGLKLARSIAAGLAFLHSEVVGFHGKPSIAHRDIKSKNILVMADNEACLADFGLALTKTTNAPNDDEGGDALPPASPFAGTKRYMAPEVLGLYPRVWGGWEREYSHDVKADKKQSVDLGDDNLSVPEELAECRHSLLSFEVYQSADIYALALVLWEIWRRCTGEKYELPYFDAVPADPNFLQMYRVVVMGEPYDSHNDTIADLALPLQVCHLCSPFLVGRRGAIDRGHLQYASVGKRPALELRHNDCAEEWMNQWATVISECWHPRYTHRLSALRVRKTLAALERTLN